MKKKTTSNVMFILGVVSIGLGLVKIYQPLLCVYCGLLCLLGSYVEYENIEDNDKD